MCQRLAEEWTRQGKKTTAEDVANTLQIVPSGSVTNIDGKNEQLAQVRQAKRNLYNDNKEWNVKLKDWQEKGNGWNSYYQSKMFKVMDTPSVMLMLGKSPKELKTYNSFFKHVLNVNNHAGLVADDLKNLPNYLSNPLMIFQTGNGIISVVDIQTSSNATVIVPIRINESIKDSAGVISVVNRVPSLYAKTKGSKNPAPKYGWFADEIANGKLLYINKKEAFNGLLGLDT
ncbi:MuF-C-terminal domain-containing protein [Acidaminococcus sp. LBK-2]|uniref:MuF-C-terminal domain-containing protein n=1 Tax=Acidaminococcus sp. LBK-2 TaxID=3456956 RepID=UPI003FA495C8